jgi:hypothetical protein
MKAAGTKTFVFFILPHYDQPSEAFYEKVFVMFRSVFLYELFGFLQLQIRKTADSRIL